MESTNLCNLSDEKRAEIEIDKRKWSMANTWLRTLKRGQILAKLDVMSEHEQSDMRRRLNVVIERKKKRKTGA